MKTPRIRKRFQALVVVLSLTILVNYGISAVVDSSNQPIGSGTPRPSVKATLDDGNQPIGSGTPRPSLENQPIGSGTPRP